MNAELSHALLDISEFTRPRTNRWPVIRLPGGCSLVPAAVTYATCGRVPSRRSV